MGRDVKMDVQLDVSNQGYAGRLDVIAGPTGRRRRTRAEKARVAAESLAPGAIISEIAQRYGVTRWQVYDWRRRFRTGRMTLPNESVPSPAFVPLVVEDESQPSRPTNDVVRLRSAISLSGPGGTETRRLWRGYSAPFVRRHDWAQRAAANLPGHAARGFSERA